MNTSIRSHSLQVKGVCKAFYREHGEFMQVLQDITFRTASGGITCIIGPSGSGKTTLLNIVSGLEAPDEGEVLVDGGAIQMNRPVIGYVFQTPRLLPWRTIEHNIIFAMKGMGVPRHAWEQRLHTYLKLVGLSEFRRQYPLYLSGGMQQRVGLARAFAVEPSLILMDEPFSSVDELTAIPLREETLRLNTALKQTTLFVTHNLMEAAFFGSQVVVLSARPARVVAVVEHPEPWGTAWGSVAHAEFTDHLRGFLGA